MTTETSATMRRCIGSARFGIEPHEAPVSDFPKQPSRKDGLGTMCTEHWRAYVKGLNAEREARATGEAPTPLATKSAPTGRTARKAKAPDPKVADAETLIAQVDALPGPEHAKRVGDADVQAALELVGQVRAPSADGAETMEA